MRALVYTGPERVEMRDAPDPAPGAGEALVRVDAVGLCGSDMHAYRGHDARRPAPLILGHEAAGTVLRGEAFEPGARVTINPLVACGACADCGAGRENLCASRQILSMPPREGAFAELVAVPERNLVRVPDGVSSEIASLAEPLACGWHALKVAERSAIVPPEEAGVVVLGGGAIGVGAALAARARGYARVTVVEPGERRRAALGSIEGFDALAAADPNDAPHLVVDAVGLAVSRATACAIVRPGGTIAHIGLGDGEGGIDARRLTLQEIAFVGTYTYTAADFRDTARAIFDGRLGPLDWTERRSLEGGAAAFAEQAACAVASPKMILIPEHGGTGA